MSKRKRSIADSKHRTRARWVCFADAYIAGGFRNQAEAAIEAGYSPKTAYSQASRLLKKVEVQELIRQRMRDNAMSADEVLYRLGEQARVDLRDFIGLSTEELKNHPRAWLVRKYKQRSTVVAGAVTQEQVDIETVDSNSALTTLARHHGLLKDGVTINVNIELVVQLIDALQQANLDPAETFQRMIHHAQQRATPRPD